MSTRTPLITVPLSALKVGMQVKDHNGNIGHIAGISSGCYPIKVQFNYSMTDYYNPEGFLIHGGYAAPHQMQMGITLVDSKPCEVCSTDTKTDIPNEGFTTEELDAINSMVNTRNMTRASAILMVIG